MVTINRVANLEELVSSAALKFIDVVAEAQSLNGGVYGDGIARVVLTGGGIGIGLLKELRRLDHAAKDQGDESLGLRSGWELIQSFFGDERNVPANDPESNEGQAREALLDHVDIPNRHIHGFDLGAISMSSAADAYEEELREYAPQGFDLHLLGMGGEGHINSLFPHTEAGREQEEYVVAVHDSPKPPSERLTLTLPAIARAKRVWLLVAGGEKA